MQNLGAVVFLAPWKQRLCSSGINFDYGPSERDIHDAAPVRLQEENLVFLNDVAQ